MRLGDALSQILDCAQDELVAAGRTVPDDVLIAPGQMAFDNICGQLWARVIRGGPSENFPDTSFTMRRCGAPIFMRVGLGITRCQTGLKRVGDRENGYPTPAEQTADALGLICDQGALYRAIACCESSPGEPDLPDIAVGEWTQLEPQQVIGGEWQFWISADLTCDDSPGGSP